MSFLSKLIEYVKNAGFRPHCMVLSESKPAGNAISGYKADTEDIGCQTIRILLYDRN